MEKILNELINRLGPSLSSGWLADFIDAEGFFTGRVKYCRTSLLKKAPQLALEISQKEYYILVCIRNLFIHTDKYISYDKICIYMNVSVPIP